MSEKGLSFAEVSILVILLVEGEQVSNIDLKERYGVTLTGESRLKLNDLKLVESRKQGRAFVHLLTSDGWGRVAEEIESGIPMPRGVAGAMNLALVSLVRRILARTGQPLNYFYLPESAPAALASEAEAAALPSEDGDELTERIRAAYTELAAEPGAWVSLARLRPLLGDAERTEVDRTLKGMIHLPDVSIIPESNQKVLTSEGRAAAVIIGDQEKHLISIEAL
ncbi:hypothetical protein AB0395_38635 [Streptosporangium sp. NPDC051023]|uniref:hypothetical protein n=1 Tax=Streptosporangium sp. NPDC051023 TaxID=3155410 RepID=UPI00344D8AE1